MGADAAALPRLEIDVDGLIAFTQELVRTPSVHLPATGEAEAAAAACVAARFASFGWEPVVEEVAPGRPNVWTIVEGGSPGPTLLFAGHTDVVTPGDTSGWQRDPFGAEIVDGKLFGRGSADMKGGLAAMTYAAAAVAAAGPFPGRLMLAAFADEEGLMLGSKHFVAQGRCAGVEAAIVCEPEGGEVCTSQKGALRVVVSARGRMAHGAMPDHGANPVTALAMFIARAQDLEQELRADVASHEHLGRAHITPTVVHGGTLEQMNVIPADAVLALDIRTLPGNDHERLLARIRGVCEEIAKQTGVTLTPSVIDDRPPTETPVDAPVVRALVEAHRAVTGQIPPFGGVPGTTDGTILWRDAKIPVVVYGPGGKWIAHQADEFVALEDLIQAAQVYARAAVLFLGAR